MPVDRSDPVPAAGRPGRRRTAAPSATVAAPPAVLVDPAADAHPRRRHLGAGVAVRGGPGPPPGGRPRRDGSPTSRPGPRRPAARRGRPCPAATAAADHGDGHQPDAAARGARPGSPPTAGCVPRSSWNLYGTCNDRDLLAPLPTRASGPVADRPFPAFVVDRASATSVEPGVRTLALDDLPPGEVTVGVDWSAVNYKDGMVTRPGQPGGPHLAARPRGRPGRHGGRRGRTRPSPPGGEVIAHGYDLGVARHGGFAALARVPAGWVVPLPAGLTARRAAIIGTAGFTAALSLHRLEHHGLAPGDGPVLVTGASGGVGCMAVALLAAPRLRGGGEHRQGRRARRTSPAWAPPRSSAATTWSATPERTLGPERWAGAVDCVGGPTLAAVLRTLRYGAAVAASGLTGGTALETTVYPFIVRDVALLGVDTVLTPIAERRAVWEPMAAAWPPGRSSTAWSRTRSAWTELAPALERILAGRVRGRMLVRPGRSDGPA